MELNKALDFAIMRAETANNPALRSGYQIGARAYENYLSNTSWAAWRTDMEQNYPSAFAGFRGGGGKELEEKGGYPPKMASFGSSSRMIYSMMRDTQGFRFEEKLATTVGGVANLDGFYEDENRCVFVEAKCREPYSAKSKEIEVKYRALYEALTQISCAISPANDQNKMTVDFSVFGKPIRHFDIKQMISHLLGIATAYLNGKYTKPISFIYLAYNPTALTFDSPAYKDKICTVYRAMCEECNAIDFQALFLELLLYLQKTHHLGEHLDANAIAAAFSFRLADQNNMNL